MRKIYIRLHLKKFSCAKLSRSSVLKKIQGLHELAEMECVDALPAIQPLLNHKSLIVRQESFIAVVRLGAAPFALVDKFSDPITPWMQLIMHKHLTVSSPERIPKFHHWFYQPNREIQKFAIAMAHQFRQTEAIPHLAVLLISQDIEMAGLAVNALGDMGAVEYADAIANLGKSNPLNDALSVQVIRALGQIGNAEKHGAWLAWQMTHGSYHIRLEAMGVMRKLNLNCRDFLIDFNTANDDVFESMYAHITEPLLQ